MGNGSLNVLDAKPFVKFVGGKRKLIPSLRERMPEKFGTYYEPFLGGGALFFGLQPERAVLSDINKKLMTVYIEIKENVEQLIRLLKVFRYNREQFERVRKRNFDVGPAVQRAAEFIYLNKTCFNGLYRENMSGQFNVPFGKYDNPTICDEDNLRACSEALKTAFLHARGFEAVEERASKGDFVYFDPPYAPLSATSNFTSYSKEGFNAQNQEDLRDAALRLKKRGVHVLLSNSSAPLIYDLYEKDFQIDELMAARSVNSDSEKRGKIKELLIY